MLIVATLKERWESYRAEDPHECNLFAIRINALLTSQSVVVAAFAFLVDKARLLSIAVAILGLVTCILSLMAISAGCIVMRRWHKRGRGLLDEDTEKQLEGLHLGRNQPDWLHNLSIDCFGVGLGASFILFWIVTIAWLWCGG